MKLYIPIVGWDYEGGIALGVYDDPANAHSRLESYTKDLYYDTKHVISVNLNEAEEIDI
jgi:hypothetical protein